MEKVMNTNTKLSTLNLSKNEIKALEFFDITTDNTVGELKKKIFEYRMCNAYVGKASHAISTLKNVLETSDAYTYGYPYNLLKAIYGCFDKEYIDNILRNSQIINNFLTKAVFSLSIKEQEVIKYRFHYGETLEEVGKHLDVSGSRVRQIEAKSLRKLRSPNRSSNIRIMFEINKYDTNIQKAIYAFIAEINLPVCLLVHSVCDLSGYSNRSLKLITENVLLQDLLTTDRPDKIISTVGSLYNENRNDEPIIYLGSTTLDELNLSVRTTNALARRCIETVDDIIESMEDDVFFKIRNLGVKGSKEVIEKLISIGVKDRIPESIMFWYENN